MTSAGVVWRALTCVVHDRSELVLNAPLSALSDTTDYDKFVSARFRGAPVTVKKLPPFDSASDEARAAQAELARAIQILSAPSSLHVVRVLGLTLDPNNQPEEIVLERLEPFVGSLFKRSEPLPRFIWSHVAREILHGLAFFDSHGIRYECVCLENLFVTPEVHLKLTGPSMFNATSTATSSDNSPAARAQCTPEHGELTVGAVYSFGALLLELATGQASPISVERSATTVTDSISFHFSTTLESLTQHLPHAEPLIRGCLDTTPAQRWDMTRVRGWFDAGEILAGDWSSLTHALVLTEPNLPGCVSAVLETLLPSGEEQRAAFTALGALFTPKNDRSDASEVSDTMQLLCNSGALPRAVVTSIHAYANDVESQRTACVLLGAMAGDASLHGMIIDAGGVEALLSVVKRPNVAVLKALVALHNLAQAAVNVPRLVEAGAIEAALELMRAQPNLKSVQDASARLLYYCTFADGIQDGTNVPAITRMCAAGAVETLVAALRTHSDQANLCWILCAVLARLAMLEETPAQLVTEATLGALAETMRAHAAQLKIQIQICNVLRLIATTLTKEQLPVLLASGVLQGLIAALRAFVDDENVRTGGAMTLYYCLNVDKQIPEHPAFQLLSSLDIAEPLVAVLKHRRASEIAKAVAMGAIDELSKRESNREQFIAAGVIEPIVLAIDTHRTDLNVQVMGCHALAQLAASESARVPMIRAGALATIRRAATDRFTADVHVQEAACMALRNLSASDDPIVNDAFQQSSNSIVTHLSLALRDFKDNAEIVEHVMHAAWSLSSNDVLAKALMSNTSDVFALTRKLLPRYLNNEMICMGAIGMMSNLTATPAFVSKVSAAFPELLPLIKRYRSSVMVQVNALAIIVTLCPEFDTRYLVRFNNGVNEVLQSMKAHPEVAMIQASGAKALVYLCLQDKPTRALPVARTEILPTLMSALTTHMHDDTVAPFVVCALINLGYGREDATFRVPNPRATEDAANLNALREASAMGAVIVAGFMHMDGDADVAPMACGFVLNMSAMEANHAELLALSAPDLVIKTLFKTMDTDLEWTTRITFSQLFDNQTGLQRYLFTA